MALNDFVEMSDELAVALDQAAKRVEEISDQLRAAEAVEQGLLNDVIAPLSEFKVGDDVMAHGRRYRVTKITGEKFGLTGQRPKVWIRYHGQRVKVDGSLMGRERRIYELKPITVE